MRVHLHWYRCDLRLDDPVFPGDLHPAEDRFLPVFVLENRLLGAGPAGIPRTGPFRMRLLAQSLADLDRRLRERGSGLLVLRGDPADLLSALARACGADSASWQVLHTREERDAQQAVQQALERLGGMVLHTAEDSTLLHPDDLPFDPGHTPDVFTVFRKQVEKAWKLRPPGSEPLALPPWPELPENEPWQSARMALNEPGLWSGLPAAGPPDPLPSPAQGAPDARSAWPLEGGETAALARLHDYIHGRALVRRYKATRNGLLGEEYSSKLSPWLALGCLSPRRVYAEVRQHEARHGANESTYWLLFELLWRDFFRFQAMRHRDRLFAYRGMLGPAARPPALSGQLRPLARWCAGRTGQPFIDANMTELLQTGWMSNRGRQNVASWLVHDLGLDWRLGAAWMEYLLLDYDPASNYGNWQYAAGVGQDPRSRGEGQRRFDPERQARMYDPQGAFVRCWLQENAPAANLAPGRLF
jgi:deoxyribodipyrimidine photo-lyase